MDYYNTDPTPAPPPPLEGRGVPDGIPIGVPGRIPAGMVWREPTPLPSRGGVGVGSLTYRSKKVNNQQIV